MTSNRLEDAAKYDVQESSDGLVRRIRSSAGDVYQLQAHVLPFLMGNLYLFPMGEGAWTLIDSGCGTDECNADLECCFQTVHAEFEPKFSIDKIKRILLTHAHIDHFGGAYEWSRRTGAEIWIHAFESRLVSSYDDCARVENVRYARFLLESGVAPEDVQPILDGFGFRPKRAKSVDVARKLLGGERFDSAQVIYLPGHSSGHIAILFGDVVFSGDLLLSKTLTQIWPTRMTPQTGAVNYITSLKRLERLSESFERRVGKKLLALPAHEDAIFDVPNRVEQALRGMERRNQRLLMLLNESNAPASLAEITRKMYWSGRPNREFFALSDVGSRVELLLQLDLLRVVDTERATSDTPTLYYRPSFADAESAKNTIQQVVRMYLSCNESDSVERDAEF